MSGAINNGVGLPAGPAPAGAGGSSLPWWQVGAGARLGVPPSPTGAGNYNNLPPVPMPQFPTPAMNLAMFGHTAQQPAGAPTGAAPGVAPAPQQVPGSNAPAQSIFQQIAAKAPMDVYGNTTQSSVPTAAPQAPTMNSIAGIPLPTSAGSGSSMTGNLGGNSWLGAMNAWQNALLASGNYTLSPNALWNNGPVTPAPAPAPAPAPTATGTDTWPPTNPTPVAQSGGGVG